MSADFTKAFAAIAKALEEHADRDGLSPVRRAVFLARGGHAPGEPCPTAQPSERGERAWCFSCERWHEPMEWGEGCTDTFTERGEVASHHKVRQQVAPGVWVIARPLRDTSWWHRRKQEKACRNAIGHCWHPDSYVDWWCCECSAETDGCPPHRCLLCTRNGAQS